MLCQGCDGDSIFIVQYHRSPSLRVPPLMLPVVPLLVLLGIGMLTDLRARRVPNVLVLGMLGWALVGALAHWSPATTLGSAALGGLTGLACWLPFWLLGLLGAGDVKYFTAGAAWIGPALAWQAALLTAVVGGLLGFATLVWNRGIRHATTATALQYQQATQLAASADLGATTAAQRTFPYAVPMGLALAFAALRPEVVQSW